jgi:hypothetical protein
MHHCINNPVSDFPSITPYKLPAHIPNGFQIDRTVVHCGLLGSATTYKTTQRNNPEDHSSHFCRSENLKTQVEQLLPQILKR